MCASTPRPSWCGSCSSGASSASASRSSWARRRRRRRVRVGSEPPRPDRAGPARLLIVDDHELARAGLRSMLAGEPDLEVVGEAGNGREALALCARLAPDLILMDVRMPELDGLAATAAVKA